MDLANANFSHTQNALPKIIELVGFPLPGNERWSNRFTKDQTKYHLVRSYPTKIRIEKVEGTWTLSHDHQFPFPIVKIDNDQRSPVGEWTNGAIVFSI